MTILYNELLKFRFSYMTTGEVADVLGITLPAVSRLVRQGKIPGVKMGRAYLVPRAAVHEFAKTHVASRGRPRTKRKYTKRSP